MRIIALPAALLTLIIYSAGVFAAALPIYTDEKLNLMVTPRSPAFVIKLKSNPTTGYSWFLREYDSKLIHPVSHKYEPSEKKEVVGAGGFEYWTFKVMKEGFIVPQQTTLRLVYARPWQGADGSSQVTFRISTAG